MRKALLRLGLLLIAGGLVVFVPRFAGAGQVIGPVTVTPPQPMAAIEFVKESGVERWEVKLTRGGSTENAHLRVSGSGCTFIDEVYPGMITPLYEDMTFKTKSGKTCTVQAIER